MHQIVPNKYFKAMHDPQNVNQKGTARKPFLWVNFLALIIYYAAWVTKNPDVEIEYIPRNVGCRN
jgi:hypothetical protein